MGIELEFVTKVSGRSSDTYRLTFEGEIQPSFKWLLLENLFVPVEPNIFEAPISRIQAKFGSKLDFIDLFVRLAEQFQQQDYKLELVSSISKADRDRLANKWLHYGIFAVTLPNQSFPSYLVPYFSLENYCSAQQSEPDNQVRVESYLKTMNIPSAHWNIAFITVLVHEILPHFIDGEKIWLGGVASLSVRGDLRLKPTLLTVSEPSLPHLEQAVFYKAVKDAQQENQTPWITPALIELTKSEILKATWST
ncbi:MAG: hypothetical protein HC820_10080 [Hydrococcus sp. RM1_1_31]|nr:hypothetical protein [Hydrococcus sp. RM1_1_31]